MCGFSQGCDKTSVKREFQRGAVTLGLVTRCFPVLRHESLIFLKLSALWRYLTRILVTLPSGCLRRSRRAVGRERRPSRTKQLCYRFHSNFSLSPFLCQPSVQQSLFSGRYLTHGTSPKFLVSSTSILGAPSMVNLSWHGTFTFFCTTCNHFLWVNSIAVTQQNKWVPLSVWGL